MTPLMTFCCYSLFDWVNSFTRRHCIRVINYPMSNSHQGRKIVLITSYFWSLLTKMWPYLHAINCALSVQEQDVECLCQICALSECTHTCIYTCIDFNILIPIGLYIFWLYKLQYAYIQIYKSAILHVHWGVEDTIHNSCTDAIDF